ncbi:IS5/IS1182 family transposase [Bifidobacterium scardovii]|uniref:IS5/IS1182 family transposase n=3 Tax=Bifidobacterium scardovii TaxID=158787 RepID=UPI0006529D56|nr:IS5/IS1182 family transposase [Bifidobacterium scardovii]
MRVAHLLPRQRGNVAVDNYTFVNALLWMCRTGAPWRDLPECYGKWITVYQRFNRWSGNGAIERLFTALQEERIIAVEVRVPALDSTSVKVHQHATGAPEKGGRSPS